MAETWKPFHDALALRPTASFIPDPYTVLEHTGDLLSQFEEGKLQLVAIKQKQLLLLKKTSSIQISFQILLRTPMKRKPLKAQRKAMSQQEV